MSRTYTRTTLFVTVVMLFGMIATIPSVSAQGDDVIAWGVEYDQANFYDDFQALTDLPHDELIQDIMDSATYAGFDLTIIEAFSGTSSLFVEQWDDSTTQQIADNEGNMHTVTTRMTELTLRHGMRYDAGILSDWADKNASFDIGLHAGYENFATADLEYTEYVTSDMKLVGGDLSSSVSFGFDAEQSAEIEIGGGTSIEPVDFDFTVEYEVGIDFASTSLESSIRFNEPSNILNAMNDEWDFDWDCYADCGAFSGSFATQSSYDVLFTGLPLDEVGLEADALDLHISDSLSDSGTFSDVLDWGASYKFGDYQNVTIDDAGNTVQVKQVEAVPLPPGMLELYGQTFKHAFMIGSGDQTTIGEALGDAFGNWADDAEENFETGSFVCDNGEEIPADWVNDGEEDCSDGSDEGVEDTAESELMEKIEAVVGAFLDSNFEKTMEAFGEKLEDRMEDYEDFEVNPPYVDAEFYSLWSESDQRFVGFQLLVETEAGNTYSLIGPESDTQNNNPPTEIHFEYLIGEVADQAENEAEVTVTLEELAPMSQHDVAPVYQALGLEAPDDSGSSGDNPPTHGDGDSSSVGVGPLSGSALVVAGIAGFVVLIVIAFVTIMLITRRGGDSDFSPAYSAPQASHGQAEYNSIVQEMSTPPQAPMDAAGPPTASNMPSPAVQGQVQPDGFEYLEWPQGTDNWWWRDQNGQWQRWQK